MRRSSRNSFSFPDFSLRRLLLQGARAARGSSPLGPRLCDAEKGLSKHDKNHSTNIAITTTAISTASTSNNKNSDTVSGTQSSVISSGSSTTKSPNNSTNQQRISMNSLPKLDNNNLSMECPLCYNIGTSDDFFNLLTCKHFACRACLESYLIIEITESRTDIACPQCSEPMHPSDIQTLLKRHPEIVCKYEDFMVRRVLLSDPDSRWCPAPDCSYVVIASGCASCPRLRCERPGCDVNFCYHCKAEWHPDQTCDAARASRQSPTRASGSISQDSQHRDDIKPCPRCQVLIVKMDDGSCNHMVCAVCGSEFCWLCMKEISDLHYLSPSGCTFWGKKPWSRKKKLLWQLGTLVGAPIGIALVAGIAVPAMIIGIPVWVGRKIHTRYKTAGKHKRNCAVLGGVAASVIVSPVLAGLAVAIGVPILLFYVYGVVPVSLCRAGCGVSTTRDGVKFDFDEEEANGYRNQDAADAVSRLGATSIGEVSLSVASGSHIGVSTTSQQNQTFGITQKDSNRESTTALAGSICFSHRLEVQADVSSETASAVTCISEKSGNTLNDTASTKALAGSILSYKQHMDSSNLSEDGVSERVRFDNTVCYVIDTSIEDTCTSDKASLGSGRSFRSSDRSSFRDDIDTSSLTSTHKRIALIQRIPKLNNSQHRNLSLDSNNGIIINNKTDNINLEEEEVDNNYDMTMKKKLVTPPPSSHLQQQQLIHYENECSSSSPKLKNNITSSSTSTLKTINNDNKSLNDVNNLQSELLNNNNNNNNNVNNKQNMSGQSGGGGNVSDIGTNSKNNISKTTILRNLFFFQNENGGSNS